MPRRRTQDMVHVVATDHLIRRRPGGNLLATLEETEPVLRDVELLQQPGPPDIKIRDIYRAMAVSRASGGIYSAATGRLGELLAEIDITGIEPYLHLAESQITQRQFEDARNTLTRVLGKSPDHPLALQWMGLALTGIGEQDAAVEQFRHFVEQHPDRPEANYNLALLLLAGGQANEALAHLSRAIKARPNQVMAWYYLGQTYRKLGRDDDATAAYQRALEIEPEHTRSYVALGSTLMGMGKQAEAKRYWQHGLKTVAEPRPITIALQQNALTTLEPSLGQAGDGVVLSAVRPGLLPVPLPNLDRLEASVAEQLQDVAQTFRNLASQQEIPQANLADAYGTMAQVYHAYEFNHAAECCYINAIRLTPMDVRWHHLIGALYQQVGDLSRAEQFFLFVQKLQRTNVSAVVRLGTIYLETNRLAQAREQFENAIKLKSDSVAARNGLGEVLLAERKFSDAIDHFKVVLQQVPAANRVHYSLAMAYRGLGDVEKAKAHLQLRGTVGIRPVDPWVDSLRLLVQGERIYLIRGRMAFGAGRYQEAAEAFAKAAEAQPDSARAHVNLGTSLGMLGKEKEAIEHYRTALVHNPKNHAANYNLGTLLARHGNHAKAIEYFRAAIQSNPKDLSARRQLGQSLAQVGHVNEALAHFTQLLQIDPRNELSRLALAKLLVEQRRYKEAIEWLDEIPHCFRQRVSTAHALAHLLATCPDLSLRDGKQAIELARGVVASEKTITHMETMALALAEAGRCDEAAVVQKQVVTEAEKTEDADLVTRLKEDLLRYEKGAPCRPPVKDVSGQQSQDASTPATKAEKTIIPESKPQGADPPAEAESQNQSSE